MVTNLTLRQFEALTFDYIPHMKLELAEMIIYIYIVEKGTVVTKAYVTSDPEGRKQNMIISSESGEFVDDLVQRSVRAYEIMLEIDPDSMIQKVADRPPDTEEHLSDRTNGKKKGGKEKND